jgi:hypothetical protein
MDIVRSGIDHPRLWLQQDDGIFREATAEWGLLDKSAEMAVVLVDYDGDLDLDLAAVGWSQPDLHLLRNDADHFTDVSESMGFTSQGPAISPARATSLAWADYDRDGDLDVYVTRYDYSLPDTLWSNVGGDHFVDVTKEAGLTDSGTLSFQPLWLDFDNDGDLDLYVSNDKGTRPKLYRNQGDGTFIDASRVSGLDLPIEGMGVAGGDLNHDGSLDLYVANVPGKPTLDTGNLLYFGDGNLAFTELARPHGAAVDRWSWGVDAFDADLDGDLDLFVAVEAGREDLAPKELGNVMLENVDGRGTFRDITRTAGLEYAGDAYAVASGDFDDDGWPDLVVANRTTSAISFYRNVGGGARHFLKVRLRAGRLNTFGIGARVSIEAGGGHWEQELRCGEGLMSSRAPELIFGLDTKAFVDRLSVRWPTGATTELRDLSTDQTVLVREGE